MKIHEVRFRGFGPFRDSEVVDLDAYDDAGIFLITGRTGAGKTSVLDAITYALFGRVPRYDEAAGDKVRSDHLTPTEVCEVTVDFTVTSGRHRITRRPAYKRPKLRGEGLTTVRAFFEMEELRDGTWHVVETKEGNADRYVSDVVPFSAEQFQQVVLLAQGQFQQFLVADSGERRDILSRLFDTQRFTAYAEDLRERATALGRELQELSTQVATHASNLAQQAGVEVPDEVDVATGSGLVEWVDDLANTHGQAVAQARAAKKVADEEVLTARTAYDAVADLRRRQDRLEQALRQRAEIEERASEVQRLRQQLDLGRRARLAEQACRAAETRARELQQWQGALGQARDAWAELFGDAESGAGELTLDGGALQSVLEEITAEVAALRVLAAEERRLPELQLAEARATAALEAFEHALTERRREQQELAEQTQELERRSAELAELLEQLDGLRAEEETAARGLAAARERQQILDRLTAATGAQLVASEAHDLAAARVTELVRRQLAGYAGVLAQELTSGEPCPVCGGCEHPQPAGLATDHVDAESIDAARAERDQAQSVLRDAEAEVTRLQVLLATAEENAEGRPLPEWEEVVRELAERAAVRRSLQEEQVEVRGRREQVAVRAETIARQLEAAQEEADGLRRTLTLAEDELRRTHEQVANARGEHPSVAARVEEVRARGQVTRLFLEAHRRHAEAEAECGRAQAEMAAVLGEQDFQDAAAVRAARLEEGELRRVEEAVRAHDLQEATVTSTLAEADLQDLPADPVDPAPAAERLEQARATQQEHDRALGAAETQEQVVVRLAASIRAGLDGSKEKRAEYDLVNQLQLALRGLGQNERRIELESFALAAELEEIVATANRRLARMTGGRFEFQHSDTEDSRRSKAGLGLDVLDAHTGEARSPRSLSGGEKFQASLALALGLAEVVTARAGGIRLDTLFIDEGFGTLDPETLESTMATLDSLREGGRTVGLISHVTALKETIPAQLHVDVTPGGWSTIRQR